VKIFIENKKQHIVFFLIDLQQYLLGHMELIKHDLHALISVPIKMVGLIHQIWENQGEEKKNQEENKNI
jgi:hypothetical protein